MLRERKAYHEAGHAVAAYCLRVEVRFATILPDHDCGGFVGHGDLFCDRGLGSDRANLERAIKISLAGPLAEARFICGIPLGGRQDYDCAFGLARYLAGSAGKWELLCYLERETKALLDHYWGDVERVARALLEHDQLSGTAVKNIIEAPTRLEREDREDKQRLEREDREDKQRWIDAMAADETDLTLI
jgi:ATP-dependent Zn protease